MAETQQKPKIMVQNISCILPQQSNLGALYLGNVYGAQNAAILKEYGIRAVLTSSIQTDINYSFRDVPFHMKIAAHDKQNYNLKEHINKCIQFIEKARQLTNVYVHCFAGVSRSAAIVCAYIMWKLKWNYETTIAFVKAKRIVAKPNQGFVKQLMEMEQVIMEQASYISSQSSQLQKQTPNQKYYVQQSPNPLAIKQDLQYLAPKVVETNAHKQNHYPSTNTRQLKQQQSIPEKVSGNANLYYISNNPKNNITKQSESNRSYDHKLHNQINKDIYKAQEMEKSTHRQFNHQKLQQTGQPNHHHDKFLYLQNFFPQNHTGLTSHNSNTQKPPSSRGKPGQNELKPRNNNSITSTSQNWVKSQNQYQYSKTSSQGFKTSQTAHTSSVKNLKAHQFEKPTSSSSQLVLGGRKPSSHHNNIQIPKVSQRKDYQATNQTHARFSEFTPKTNNNFFTSAETSKWQFQHRASHGIEIMPKVDEYMWKMPNHKIPTTQNATNLQMIGSPVNQNVYNKKFDFRAALTTEGFFNQKSLSAQKQTQKTTSRVLVRPKDLPGYKNH